ncbi:hypothetical protein [Cyanobium sp. Morenito 9A2]|uniref:hypothetical protein n=1 Tax=Cyanobium sp. Morenito 9A2 TaxID=2823718 RepID=UPI0020CFBD95|nr:hypothetical protein [Cyanobium sp. Morenito 9A2]
MNNGLVDDAAVQGDRREQSHLRRPMALAPWIGMGIALVRQVGERLCPGLSRQAVVANAADNTYTPLDLQALIDGRHRAEAELQHSQPVLYRDRFALEFFTPRGEALAAQADAISLTLRHQGCPYGNR